MICTWFPQTLEREHVLSWFHFLWYTVGERAILNSWPVCMQIWLIISVFAKLFHLEGWWRLHSLPGPLLTVWVYFWIQVGFAMKGQCLRLWVLTSSFGWCTNCIPSWIQRTLLGLLMPWSCPSSIIVRHSRWGFPWRWPRNCNHCKMLLPKYWQAHRDTSTWHLYCSSSVGFW